MCPVGTISDWVQRISERLGVRPRTVPQGLDRALSLLKYAVLGVILFFTYRSAELVFRGYDPCYALIGRHGEDITFWAYAVSGGILLGSVLVTLPFCRWLCPLAAVLNPFSRFGVARIKRNSSTCLDCGLCARACPMGIAVDQAESVREARCISCLSCVGVCPDTADAPLVWGPPSRFGHRWSRWVLAGAIIVITATAVGASHFLQIPSFVSVRGDRVKKPLGIELEIEGLTCRGRATMLMYFLEREDIFELSDFIELRAWPGPSAARATVSVDGDACTADDVRRAITEPYYDKTGGAWRFPPFVIRGYDPLAMDEDG